MIKRILLIVIGLMPLLAHADEGMWMLYNLPDAVYKQMQAEGFMMLKSALYEDSTALKNCVVNFGGYCTGEVVSPNGLVMTNHHCGFEAIRSHSTVEHDYMLNGFYADSIAAELPNEDLFVAFMVAQRDVTQELEDMEKDLSMGDLDVESAIEELQEKLTAEARQIDSTYYVEILPFYEGNAYYATTYQRYDDVRLVFALPKSMGKFGGETDNWMWPRQTCDFSVFRIYVDPVTGGPARYSEKNVPMTAKAWLPVSTEGYKADDFAMVIGYPGSTQRYLSSYGIQNYRDCINDPMQQVRGVKQAVMKKYMDQSEEVRIKYDGKYARSANYWKNAIGMNKCIDSIGIISMKRDYEARIQQWMDSTGMYKDELNFVRLDTLYKRLNRVMRPFTFFAESFGRTRSLNELTARANRYINGMPLKGNSSRPSRRYMEFEDNSNEWDRTLDEEAMAVVMANYRTQVDKEFLPDFYETIDRDFGGDYAAYLKAVWDNSILMAPGAHIPYRMTRKMKKDLGIQMATALAKTLSDIMVNVETVKDSIAKQEKLLCAAKLRMEQDMPHYSDANFTMRLTYGQVGGYCIGGYDSGYYTTAESMVRKMEQQDSIADYFAEPVMKELLTERPATDGDGSVFGKYADSVSKTLNLCFLTNNDITGGNSGSPVIDGKGRLIGLAFDGNWDSLSADIFFDTALARCISVDIRYVLYMMKAWGKADRLLKEMGVHI